MTKKSVELEKAKRAPKEYSVDPKLDRMYARNIRCPYCKAVVARYTTTCVQCGITKEQIANASHLEAKKVLKKQEKGTVLWTRTVPRDLNFTKFILLLVFTGPFGGHNFYVGRKLRGWIMFASMALLVFSLLFFNYADIDRGIPMHPWRASLSWGNLFPFDVPGLVAIVIWFFDWFAAVIFNTFKYPVRIKGKDDLTKS